MAAQAELFKPRTVVDGVLDFANGMNSGIAALKLPHTQLAFATNATVRGTFLKPRPPIRKITLNYVNPPDQANFEKGLWQGGCYYKPDTGGESLMAAVDGRLFKFLIGATSAIVSDESIPGDLNPITRPQAWLWQSEKWVIWMDGLSQPIFFDQTAAPTSRRSNYGTPVFFNTTVSTAAVIVPAIGVAVSIQLTSGLNVLVGDVLTIKNFGNFQVQSDSGGGIFSVVNRNCTGVGQSIPIGAVVTWHHTGTELPPGRMGTYGLGRNWLSLVDGKQFLASDLVGGSSGTVANNFRDAVLQITENFYLVGGGNFTVPGSVGEIRAMRFVTILDKSLGQGPLQVFTPTTVFSCDAPTDRTTWQSITNPILTESLIGNGALGQNSTIGWNGDTIFRSVDGMRSLILARRDFDTWGNVPISREMERVILPDDQSLLAYGSAITFDNRLLMTASPQVSDQGIYHQALIALNADPLSSLSGKAASVYDGAWLGMNVLQLIVGGFGEVQRAFAFSLNTITNKIELYEILTTEGGRFDNTDTPILLVAETPVLLREVAGKNQFDLCRLIDGELSLDEVTGTVDIQVWYKPDSFPCWVPWTQFTICAKQPTPEQAATVDYKPGYYPRIGFGEPNPKLCDPFSNKPFREANFFQVKLAIRGYCRVIGMKIKAVTLPEPDFAKPACDVPC